MSVRALAAPAQKVRFLVSLEASFFLVTGRSSRPDLFTDSVSPFRCFFPEVERISAVLFPGDLLVFPDCPVKPTVLFLGKAFLPEKRRLSFLFLSPVRFGHDPSHGAGFTSFFDEGPRTFSLWKRANPHNTPQPPPPPPHPTPPPPPPPPPPTYDSQERRA